jgi:hypothetical protein
MARESSGGWWSQERGRVLRGTDGEAEEGPAEEKASGTGEDLSDPQPLIGPREDCDCEAASLSFR